MTETFVEYASKAKAFDPQKGGILFSHMIDSLVIFSHWDAKLDTFTGTYLTSPVQKIGQVTSELVLSNFSPWYGSLRIVSTQEE